MRKDKHEGPMKTSRVRTSDTWNLIMRMTNIQLGRMEIVVRGSNTHLDLFA